ncbi:hypothetical protein PVAND_001368 [Polypedilum vanderplanki]|uniref:GCN5-related N-acetyltransferase Rv2170-like domain-containing protein n=1 Tax=Polypedilum vanderplanki TaxID=319348 RepID=A0A9J6BP12_POLVA|nr:hypothetical protein PVAND_001368 [Polypedilum vanderplanki]
MNKLTRISLQNLQALKQMYSADRVKNVVTINAITNILDRIEKTPELEERVEFLSLNDSWKQNGTLLIKNDSRIYFNSLENSPYESVKNALDEIKIKDEITFVSISDKFRPILKDFLWYNGLETTFEQGTCGYYISNNDAKNYPDSILPNDLEFRSLSLENVDEINEISPREGGDDLNYIRNSIKHKETLAIFEKSSNELIGWCLAMDFCSIGMGVVKSNYKRSRLGSILLMTMSKKLAIEKNVDINWNVVHGHTISHKWSLSLGLKKFDTFTWLTAKEKKIEDRLEIENGDANDHIELSAFKIDKRLAIINVYNNPAHNIEQLKATLIEIKEYIDESEDILLIGDFNYNLMRSNQLETFLNRKFGMAVLLPREATTNAGTTIDGALYIRVIHESS